MVALSMVLGTFQRSLPGQFFQQNQSSFLPSVTSIHMNHDQQSWTYPNQVDAIRHSFPSVALGLLSQRRKCSVIPWRYLWSNLLLLRYLPVLLLQLSGFSFSYCFLQDSTSSLSTSRCIFHVLSYTLPILPDIWENLWWKKFQCSAVSVALC